MKWIRQIFAHPLTRGLDIDAPQTTGLRRRIIRDKPLLRSIYGHWYRLLIEAIPQRREVAGRVLELGSGAGFFRDLLPEAICSDVLTLPGIDVVADAQDLAFADQSLRAIVMTNVLHHLPDATRFFGVAGRCIRPGGVVAMIEPWVSPWSTFVYSKLHHEPFDPNGDWRVQDSGPLSGANGALPWILFHRDRTLFETTFPMWRIERVRPMMPLQYLVSGGVSLRSLWPNWAAGTIRWAERLMTGQAMFSLVVLRRVGEAAVDPR